MTRRPFPLLLLGLALMAGCTDQGPDTAARLPAPHASASPASPSPDPTPSPARATALAIDPSSLTLYAPSVGATSLGLTTTARLAATVTLADGGTSSAVLWTSGNDRAVTVGPDGTVTVQPGAGPQIVEIRAVAQADPKRSGKALVTIRSDGSLGVTVQ